MAGVGADREQSPLSDDQILLAFTGNMIKLTITAPRHRFSWRRRNPAEPSEFLLTPGQALHAAEILDARGAKAAAEQLRSLALSGVRGEEPPASR
ncbi:MAG TPA: hypothetical protein VHC49_03830 [Mycobacteriales bacterium]|nr:hypothetical protein [Mycobacteriales bacterium]